MRHGRIRVLLERTAEELERLDLSRMQGRALVLPTTQAVLVGAQRMDLAVTDPLQLCLFDVNRYARDDRFGRTLLEPWQLLPVALVALRPELTLRGVID